MQTALLASQLAQDDGEAAHGPRSRPTNLRKWRLKKAASKLTSTPFLPPDAFVFDALFFKRLYYFAELRGYTKNPQNALHITALRRFLRRFYFLTGSDMEEPVEVANGLKQLPTWVKWKDLQDFLDPDHHDGDILRIRVQRTFAERVQAVLEDNDSLIGRFWTMFVMGCICVSLALIVLEPGALPPNSNSFCIIVFTIEYLLKLLCSGFVRRPLFDADSGWVWSAIVPEGDPNNGLPISATGPGQVLDFLLAPMNLIDLISIVPFWLTLCLRSFKLKLGFLRAVRILRIVRIMKFGSFTKDFQLMAAVFSQSSGAIAAIVITLSVISLLFGAVMAQIETHFIEMDPEGAIWQDNENWVNIVKNNNIPRSMLWVAGRMTNMQSSVKDKEVIPAHWCNQVIVHAIGIMKGFVFLLPLGQMQQFSKEQAKASKEIEQLEYEVEKEKGSHVGDEWLVGFNTPFASVEVFRSDEHVDATFPPKGEGTTMMNLPLSTGKNKEPSIIMCTVSGLFNMGVFSEKSSFPAIFFEVAWVCADGLLAEDGVLTIKVLSGVNFPDTGQGWKLRISVPEQLFGDGARAVRYTGPSTWTKTSEEPEWDEYVQFNVNWDSQKSGKPRVPADALAGHLEDCMKEQMVVFSRIEEVVHKKLRRRKHKCISAGYTEIRPDT